MLSVTSCLCALHCCAVVVVGGLPRSGIDQEVVAPVVVALGVMVPALALPVFLPVLGPGLLVCVVWFGLGALFGLVLLVDPSGVVPTKAGKLLLEIFRNTRLQALVSKNPPRRLPLVLSPSVLSPVS